MTSQLQLGQKSHPRLTARTATDQAQESPLTIQRVNGTGIRSADDGELVEGYDASKDVRNYEKCSYCKGTGLRDDEIGNERRAKDPDWGCNGCHVSYAEGKTAKLSNGKPALGMKRRFVNAPTGTNVAFMKDIAKAFKPFAFVTPRYEWIESARMGWWATTTDDNGEYEKQWEDARKTYGDHIAVLVDCHI